MRTDLLQRYWELAVRYRAWLDGRFILWTWDRMMEKTRLEWQAGG